MSRPCQNRPLDVTASPGRGDGRPARCHSWTCRTTREALPLRKSGRASGLGVRRTPAGTAAHRGGYLTSDRMTSRRPTSRGQDEPGRRGDRDVGPLLAGQGPVEQGGLGEVEVDPRLQVPEPVLAGGQEAGDGGQQERVDEVRHQRPRRAADQHAEHGAGQQAQQVAEHDVHALGHRHVPHQRGAGDGGADDVADRADARTRTASTRPPRPPTRSPWPGPRGSGAAPA